MRGRFWKEDVEMRSHVNLRTFHNMAPTENDVYMTYPKVKKAVPGLSQLALGSHGHKPFRQPQDEPSAYIPVTFQPS
jgi:hypothetical protein